MIGKGGSAVRWVIGAACALVVLFAWTLCKVAGDADRREEAFWARRGINEDDVEPA